MISISKQRPGGLRTEAARALLLTLLSVDRRAVHVQREAAAGGAGYVPLKAGDVRVRRQGPGAAALQGHRDGALRVDDLPAEGALKGRGPAGYASRGGRQSGQGDQQAKQKSDRAFRSESLFAKAFVGRPALKTSLRADGAVMREAAWIKLEIRIFIPAALPRCWPARPGSS